MAAPSQAKRYKVAHEEEAEVLAGEPDTNEYVGHVKSYNEERGFGFIECDETHERYGRDVFLLRSTVRSLGDVSSIVGAMISFNVRRSEKDGKPQATSVKLLEKPSAPPGDIDAVEYVGCVKSFNLQRGFGFIECDETHEIYDRDVFLHGSDAKTLCDPSSIVGVKISFQVRLSEKDGHPQATLVRMLEMPSVSVGEPDTAVYVGHVKSYNQQRGYGFIDCAETQEVHKRDVFLLGGDARCLCDPSGIVLVGAKISFQVRLSGKDGNPQATCVRLLEMPNGAVVSESGAIAYIGRIKSYSEKNGFGFIECEETRAKYARDVYLYAVDARRLGDPSAIVGATVSFQVRLTEKDNRPQAMFVQLVDFAARSSYAAPMLSPPGFGAPRVSRMPETSSKFLGVVKMYNKEKNYAFLTCSDTQHMFDQDIYLSPDQMTKAGASTLESGDMVWFRVRDIQVGSPHAVDVTILERFEGVVISEPTVETAYIQLPGSIGSDDLLEKYNIHEISFDCGAGEVKRFEEGAVVSFSVPALLPAIGGEMRAVALRAVSEEDGGDDDGKTRKRNRVRRGGVRAIARRRNNQQRPSAAT